MNHRLGLIYPRFRYPSGDIPVGVALLAAVAREEPGLDVAICDTTFDADMAKVITFLDNYRPDVVGIGLSTLMKEDALQVARHASERGIPVFVGGPHPTIDPDSMIRDSHVDAVVIGEAEKTLPELVRMFLSDDRRAVAGAWVKDGDRIIKTEQSAPPSELDQLPFPAWDLLEMDRYLAAWGKLDSHRPGLRGVNLTTSRGCPFQCTFCQPVLESLFGKRYRQRSPASVIDEIVTLQRTFPIDGFWFTDDTLTADEAWVREFCQRLADTGLDLRWGCTTRANLISADLMQLMESTGLRKLGIGLESAVHRIREGVYGKRVSLSDVKQTVQLARDQGVQTLLFLMLGAPGETRREMLRTIEWASRLPASEASISLFVPLPGTHIHRTMVQEGYQLSTRSQDYDYYARQPFRGRLSARELRWLQRAAYAWFYAHPMRLSALTRTLRSPGGRRNLRRMIGRIRPTRPPRRRD